MGVFVIELAGEGLERGENERERKRKQREYLLLDGDSGLSLGDLSCGSELRRTFTEGGEAIRMLTSHLTFLPLLLSLPLLLLYYIPNLVGVLLTRERDLLGKSTEGGGGDEEDGVVTDGRKRGDEVADVGEEEKEVEEGEEGDEVGEEEEKDGCLVAGSGGFPSIASSSFGFGLVCFVPNILLVNELLNTFSSLSPPFSPLYCTPLCTNRYST